MFIVDRFEGAWAIIESGDEEIFQLPRSIMPSTIGEGDIIEIIVKQDAPATKNKEAHSSEILKNFFEE